LPAISFYSSHGFEHVSEREFRVGESVESDLVYLRGILQWPEAD
jgi:hypothetical protein